MKSVYLAGSYGRREELYNYAVDCVDHKNINFVSSWLFSKPKVSDDGAGGGANPARFAKVDIEDIMLADIFVVFSEPDGSYARGGKHFETGFAYAMGRKCVVVGKNEHVFHSLKNIEHFDTWEDCKAWLLTL